MGPQREERTIQVIEIMKRTLTYLIGGTLLLSQVAFAQQDDRERRGRAQGRAAATATVQQPSMTRQSVQRPSVTRQSVGQTRQMARTETPRMLRTETPRASTRTQARMTTQPNQTIVSRTDREGSARSTTSRTAIRSTADTRSFDRDGRDWDRDRDRDGDRWRYRDRDWSDRRYHRPPTTVYRNWDRGRIYSWNNNRWRWYGGTWVIYDASPSVVYASETTLPVVGSSIIASVQEELLEEGYNPGPADGVMGSRTRSAIAEYQDDHGLAVTGTINNSLLRSLDLL
jgi:hypothetical protein